ncbi:MAG: PilZ domain-containing protein [Hyphomicrobiaceae bacterium]
MSALVEQLSAGTVPAPDLGDGTVAPSALNASISGLECEVRYLRRRLDTVTTILGGWIWETDRQHRFTYMSPSVERFAGRPPEWHYGKTRQDLGNMGLRTIDGKSWVDQLEQHAVFGPVDFVRYQANRTFVLRTIGHPQFDARGEFTGYCGVAFELPSDPDVDIGERRGEERRRIVRAAEITVPGGAPPISCVLADISQTGARLRIPAEVVVPDHFRLTVMSMSIDTLCEVRWRRTGELGVRFCN